MFDVIGSLSASIDKLVIDRELSVNPEMGELCIVYGVGVYNRAQSFNSVQPAIKKAEILHVAYNCFTMIRKGETYGDYFPRWNFSKTENGRKYHCPNLRLV